ncbi:winged helix-turn-helix domain-containing protein [Streptomyces sp. NPDC087437]
MLKRHGWSWQQPTRRAIERDDDAVELQRTLIRRFLDTALRTKTE